MVDMPANTWKQSIEYARFLNVPGEIQSIRSQFKLLSTCRYRTETYPEHCQTYKMERFVERIMNECRCATRNFSWQGGRGRGETRTLYKNFVKNTRKKGLKGKHFGVFFSQILLKLYFELNDGHNQGLSFQNQYTFFNFKKWQETPPFSQLVAHHLVCLNIH